MFFTIYRYDEQATEEKITAVPQPSNQKTGSVLEISDSVTITELVRDVNVAKAKPAEKLSTEDGQPVNSPMEVTEDHGKSCEGDQTKSTDDTATGVEEMGAGNSSLEPLTG